MERQRLTPRTDWRARVEALGLVWHSAGDAAYWHEAACYRFTAAEIAALEAATRELYRLFLAAGQYVIDRRLYARFGIPAWCAPLIEQAWAEAPPALNYGRFDLGFDGHGPPKLFEFNADTPTALVEAAVVQWDWKAEAFPAAGQCNRLHDALAAKWADIAPCLAAATVHFAHAGGSAEDLLTTAYMMDLARGAGLDPRRLTLEEIGWRPDPAGPGGTFRGAEDEPVATLYKLYPWEWLVNEPFGRCLAHDRGATRWIEPVWKMIWSNKAILPILWELFPGHPNLLGAHADAPRAASYVAKPILAREGANVRVVRDGVEVARTAGDYHAPCIFQELYPLPEFAGSYPVIGSWIVDGEPAGIGVREDGLITTNLGRFVPHVIG